MPVKYSLSDCSDVVTSRQFAARLQISIRTFRRWSSSGMLPPAIKVGAIVRWRRDVVDSWIAAGCPPIRTPRG